MKNAALLWLGRFILAAGLCSCMLGPATAAQFVELTAEIELNDWSYWFLEDRVEAGRESMNNPRSIFQEPLTVRCIIGTNSWLMEGAFVRNAMVTRWFTGSNLVEQTRITDSSPLPKVDGKLNLRHSRPPVGQQYTRKFTTPDGNPGRPVRVEDLIHDATGKVCWLAFLSGPALQREGRRIPLPSALWKEFFSGDDLSDRTVVFEDSLALPRSIKVQNAQEQLLLNYQVRSSTNLLGWNIPLEFYLLQYSRASSPRTNCLELHLAAKGKVTSIRPIEELDIPQE